MKTITIFTMSMDAGGAERNISLLLPKLVKDYEVHLVLIYNSIYYSIPKEVKTHIIFSDTKNTFSRKIFSLYRAKQFMKCFLKQYKVDYVVSFLSRPNIILGMLKPHFPDIKFIISERNYTHQLYMHKSPIEAMVMKYLISKYYNRADLIFSNSTHINHGLQRYYNVKVPMKVVYNPVNLPALSLDTSLHPQGTITKIVTVGRFSNVKNHSLLIHAVSKTPNTHLTIYGDGPLRSAYEDLISETNQQDKVSIPGTTKDVQKALVNHDIFVLSSNTEGFPNVLLEALSVGVPSISTNCISGPLEILNENENVTIESGGFYKAKYGILINTGDVEGLINAIKYLKSTPDIYQSYSKLGRKRAERYSIGNIYRDFKELL